MTRLEPPRPARRNSIVMVVTGIDSYNNAYLGQMNAKRTVNIAGVEVRNGVEVGPTAIQLQGTRINGVVTKGHWLDVPREQIGRGGRVKRVLNLSTGQEVYSEVRFFDWFH